MWVIHKDKKRSWVPSAETAYLVKGVCFESLSQHQSKGAAEAVHRCALWKSAKPLKSK